MPVNQTKNNEKVVLVTGSAQRVGASIIKELHSRGWRVIIYYQSRFTATRTNPTTR